MFKSLKVAILASLLSVVGVSAQAAAEDVAKQAEQGLTELASSVSKIQLVNVNTAKAEELAAALKGVGLKKAQAIVSFREKNGEFKSLEELTQVKGIGEKTLAANKAIIQF